MVITAAVVGMGPLGLMALKNLKEDGFEIRGFERRKWVGGLWKPSFDSNLSATENTVFNGSRFRSAISDYPFPDGVDDFPTANQIWKYMESYCDHFELRRHIRFGADVKTFSRVQDKWALEYVQDGSTHTDYFDKLMIAPGSYILPRSPKLKDIEKFEGTVLHSLSFPDPSIFAGQNVLLVGFQATAQDLVVELSPHAKKVYIAHKNGSTLLSCYTPDCKAFDESQSLSMVFFQLFMTNWFPNVWNWLVDRVLRDMSKKAFPKQRKEWNLSPAPSASTTPPLIADAVYPFLEIDGWTNFRRRRYDHLHHRYEAAVTCAPEEYNPYPIPDEAPALYRNIFPLHDDLNVRKSLAFLGHGAIPLPGFVQFELIAMAISQIWQEKAHLPPRAEMQKWHQDHMAWRQQTIRRSKFNSKFLPAMVQMGDHFEWLDRTAGTGMFTHFSWFSWRSWRFWWTDRKFYTLCKGGLLTPALWRLFDMGRRKAWAGAREQIVRDNEFATKRREERLRAKDAEESRKVQWSHHFLSAS